MSFSYVLCRRVRGIDCNVPDSVKVSSAAAATQETPLLVEALPWSIIQPPKARSYRSINVINALLYVAKSHDMKMKLVYMSLLRTVDIDPRRLLP